MIAPKPVYPKLVVSDRGDHELPDARLRESERAAVRQVLNEVTPRFTVEQLMFLCCGAEFAARKKRGERKSVVG